MLPRCPRCREPLQPGQPCRCHIGAPPFWSLPLTLGSFRVLLIPLLAMPLTWLLQRAATNYASYPELETAVLLSILFLPLATQALPSLRARGGGCCLGCLTSFAMMFTLICLSPKQHVPSWSREEKPILRLDESRPASVDGVSLGDPERGTRAKVVYQEGKAVWIAGSSLEQNGKTLLSRGDSRRRLTYLFPDYQRHLTTPCGKYAVECSDGRVQRILLYRSDVPLALGR